MARGGEEQTRPAAVDPKKEGPGNKGKQFREENEIRDLQELRSDSRKHAKMEMFQERKNARSGNSIEGKKDVTNGGVISNSLGKGDKRVAAGEGPIPTSGRSQPKETIGHGGPKTTQYVMKTGPQPKPAIPRKKDVADRKDSNLPEAPRKGTPAHPITPSSVSLEQASSLTAVDHAIFSPDNGARMAVLGSSVKNWKKVARGDVSELRGGCSPNCYQRKGVLKKHNWRKEKSLNLSRSRGMTKIP